MKTLTRFFDELMACYPALIVINMMLANMWIKWSIADYKSNNMNWFYFDVFLTIWCVFDIARYWINFTEEKNESK